MWEVNPCIPVSPDGVDSLAESTPAASSRTKSPPFLLGIWIVTVLRLHPALQSPLVQNYKKPHGARAEDSSRARLAVHQSMALLGAATLAKEAAAEVKPEAAGGHAHTESSKDMHQAEEAEEGAAESE